MNRFENITKPLMWSTTLLLAAIVAGCGGSGDGVPGAGPGPGAGGGGAGVVGAVCTGASCVNLGTAANYVILDEATVTFTPTATTTTTPTITGNIGVSPAAASSLTGFALALDPAKCFSTSTRVTGKIYAADYSSVNGCATATSDTATILTTAVGDKNTAYTAAAGMATAGGGLPVGSPNECPGAGAFGGRTIVPGVYKCAVSVGIATATNLVLNGTATDVWVFEITGMLSQAGSTQVQLTGGALPQNIFWATFAAASLDTTSKFKGVILSQTSIAMKTGATINGRLLAGTQVTLDQNTVGP